MARNNCAPNLSTRAAQARDAGRSALNESDGKAVLEAFGITVPRGMFVDDADAAERACTALSGPFAVKGSGPELIHKSDAGAVRLNLADCWDVRRAVEEIGAAVAEADGALDGFLIEEMAPPGHEVIVGGVDDPQFGPVIMVGLGGVFVEIFSDVAFRICPVDRHDAEAMLDELQASPILRGARGGPAASRDALIDVILRIGGADGLLLRHAEDLAELDINPLIVSEHGAVAADARLVIRPKRLTALGTSREIQDPEIILRAFHPLFRPSNIAIVGASGTRRNRSNDVINQMLDYGFDPAKLYPIHRDATEIDGLKAYPSLQDTPEPVDYAYISLPATAIPDVLRHAGGRLQFAHVISSGFAEAGNIEAQNDLAAAAKEARVRVLGPNCNGGYSPRGKFTFCYGAAREEGAVGVIVQSGGLGIDIIRRGNNRGLRFSGVMTVGNCADVSSAELLEFYLADPDTRVVGMYIEGSSDGRHMFNLLRTRQPAKPVVILKGGRSPLGQSAAISHTGTLAGDDRIWSALSRQTGVVLASTLDEFIDKLLALQSLVPSCERPTQRAALFGNGGGTSVLAVDAFARAGIDVTPFAQATVDALKSLNLAPGASYGNPVDAPRPVLIGRDGRDAEQVLEIILEREDPQAIVMHINMSVIVSLAAPDQDPMADLLDAVDRVRQRHTGKAHFLLVLRSDGNIEYEAAKVRYRELALERGMPTYDEMPAAADALGAISFHERFLARRPPGADVTTMGEKQ